MDGEFKKFKPKSIMIEYPDEYIRKMRLTGLISLRGGGRFVDINTKEIEKVEYILENYADYEKYDSDKDYFDYMASTDENLITYKEEIVDIDENDKLLSKWIEVYPWEQIKNELIILSEKRLSKDSLLKILSNPVRLEFLIALALKFSYPGIKVMPNYPCDDEGIPTNTAGGVGDKGDIECYSDADGVLVEVTLHEGRIQTVMEVWPISRHLGEFGKHVENSKCYFIAPSIFIDSKRQIDFVKESVGLNIEPFSVRNFIQHLAAKNDLFQFN
jgi:hypothetical protein